jgi:hypothetical protein
MHLLKQSFASWRCISVLRVRAAFFTSAWWPDLRMSALGQKQPLNDWEILTPEWLLSAISDRSRHGPTRRFSLRQAACELHTEIAL